MNKKMVSARQGTLTRESIKHNPTSAKVYDANDLLMTNTKYHKSPFISNMLERIPDKFLKDYSRSFYD